MFDLDRRDFLMSGSALATMVALGGCEELFERIRNRPVRRDVATMANNDPVLEAYRDGISQMQVLGAGDPRSWTSQANVHLNFCPHGNWFFLPWHRAYLMSLEAIIRELTGESSFALPYWNWSCNRAIPAPFWEAGSVLNHSPRDIGPSDQADITIVGQNNLNDILDETDFELFASGAATALRGGGGFYGRLEGEPHNYIHGSFIGGTMGGYTSPLDPIFWLHHNILDYFWYEWNSRGNANTSDTTYTNFSLSGMFVDGDGNPATYQVGALILAPLLSYRFEEPGSCLRFTRVDEAILKRFLEKGEPIEFRPQREFESVATGVRLVGAERQPGRIRLPLEATRAAMAADAKQRLLLRIEDVAPPGADNFFVRVFVNLPADARPDPALANYAGAFAFFGDEGHSHGPLNYLVDLSPAIARLREKGEVKEDAEVEVTLALEPGSNEKARAAFAGSGLEIGALTPILIERKPEPEPLR